MRSLLPIRWVASIHILLPVLGAALPAPPLAVAGRVLDDQGAALAGAEVVLAPVPGPLEAARLELAGRAAPEPVARGRSAPDGSYRLTAPEVGLYLLRVEAKGRVPMVWSPLAVVDEVEVEPVRLPPAAVGRVEVVDAAGAPVAGARVRALPQTGEIAERRRTVRWERAPQWGVTDAAGRFAYARDARSDYQLVALLAERAPALVEGRRESVTRLALEVGIPRELEVQSGKLRAAEAVIWMEKPRLALAVTDDAGRATLALLKGGELAVVAGDATRATGRARVRPLRGEEPERPLRVELAPAHPITGRVVDSESGAPIAAALVYEIAGEGPWTLTDARGYTLDVERGSLLSPAAAARGYLPAAAPIGASSSAGEAPTLALEPAASIEGTVVDGEGRPVAEAEVTAVAQRSPTGGFAPDPERSALRAQCDARGTFRLRQVSASRDWQLAARKAGFGVGRLTVDDLAAGRRRTGLRIVLPPEGQLVGRVLAGDDRPIAGARLELSANRRGGDVRTRLMQILKGREESLKAATGEEGRFAFSGLSAGSYDLAIEASGFAPTRIPRIEVVPDEARDLGEVLLDPGVGVEGRVVDREGRAVAGAEILLDLRAFLTGREVPAAAAVTGEDGRFAIPDRRAGERIDVVARKSGYGIASVGGVVVPPERPLRLELPPLGRISGRVLDARGQPAEASVSGDLLYRMQTGAMGAMMGSTSIEAVATDAEGRFELGDLAAGEIELVARGSGGELAVKQGLELVPGGVLEGVELRFEPGARLVGRVTDPDGRPARDAFVEVNGAPGPVLAGARAVTDGDGHYRMPAVAPGRYSVVAQKHPFRRGVREIEIGAADGEVQVELQLGAGLAVRGSVVDDQGAAAAECWLTLLKAGVNVGNRIGDLSRSDGSFEIAGVEPGSYRLVAEKAGFRRLEVPDPLVVEALDVEGLQLRLVRGGAIAGHVVGLAFDDLAEVQITARAAGAFSGAAPDYEGAYRLEGLGPGDWSVVAEVRNTGRRAQGRATVADPPGDVELDLEFGRGLVLSGQVLWHGEPVAGGWVSASGGAAPTPASGQTDADGRFRLEGLAEGSYQVRASESSGSAWALEQVELAADREIRLELGSARIEGEVRDARDERPIRGAQVRVEPASGERTAGMRSWSGSEGTDADGLYRRDGIALGEQRVLASAEGYAAAEQRVTIVDRDQVSRVDFRLEPNEGVTLRVMGPAGLPPERVWAAALDAAGGAVLADYVEVGEGGRLRLTSIPRGEWTLLVGGWDLPVVRRRITSPGDAGEIVLPPPGMLRVRAPALAEGALSTLRLIGADGAPYVYPSGSQPRSDYPMNGRERAIGGLPPGPWKVEVTAADGRRLVGEATVVANSEVTIELE